MRKFAHSRDQVPRKSYQFSTARIKRDRATTLKFRRLMFTAYGSVRSSEAWRDLGCGMNTVYRWLSGAMPAPIEAVETAERRLDRRLRDYEREGERLRAEIAQARQDAKLLKAGLS